MANFFEKKGNKLQCIENYKIYNKVILVLEIIQPAGMSRLQAVETGKRV